ncbi:hypothetical protein EDB80DRAFT_820722 [Ilyonectria destructans]|nr:hypothetical protein EDB80DRAFT_820722 [Ilyonectria destructans]
MLASCWLLALLLAARSGIHLPLPEHAHRVCLLRTGSEIRGARGDTNSKFPTCWLRFPIPTRSPAVSLQRIHVRDDFCLDSSTGGALPRTCTPRVVQVGRCAAVGQKMDLWSTLGNGNSASSASWLFVLSASVLHLFCALCHLFRAFCTPSAPSAPIFHLGISAGLRRRIPAFPQPLPGGLLEGVACLSPGLSLLPPRMRRQVALSLIGHGPYAQAAPAPFRPHRAVTGGPILPTRASARSAARSAPDPKNLHSPGLGPPPAPPRCPKTLRLDVPLPVLGAVVAPAVCLSVPASAQSLATTAVHRLTPSQVHSSSPDAKTPDPRAISTLSRVGAPSPVIPSTGTEHMLQLSAAGHKSTISQHASPGTILPHVSGAYDTHRWRKLGEMTQNAMCHDKVPSSFPPSLHLASRCARAEAAALATILFRRPGRCRVGAETSRPPCLHRASGTRLRGLLSSHWTADGLRMGATLPPAPVAGTASLACQGSL